MKSKTILNFSGKLNITFTFILLMQIHYFISMSKLETLPFMSIVRMFLFGTSVFLLVIKYVLFSSKVNTQKLLIFFLLTAMAISMVYFSGGMTVSKMILYALILKGVAVEKCLAYFLKADLISLGIIGTASALGIVGNFYYVKDSVIFCLGFNNVNTLAGLLYAIIVIDLCLNYHKIKFIWWKGIAGTITIFLMTQSRAPTISLIIAVILVAFEKKKLLNYKSFIIKNSFVLVALLSLYVAREFKIADKIWNAINLMLSWRPYFFNKYYTNFPILLMGNNFEVSSSGALDNAYLMIIYKYGISCFLIYALIFYFSFKWAATEKNKAFFVVTIAFVAYFFMEFSPILVNFCVSIVYFWVKFWEDIARRKLDESKHSNSNI